MGLNADDREEMCRKVINHERCKHNMIFEYCGMCQAQEYTEEVKFPITVVDDVMGKPKTIWLRREVKRVEYYRYR